MEQEPKRGRGRPRLGDQALVKREFSLTPELMRAIERYARETGASLSTVGRELMLVGLANRGRGFEARLREAAPKATRGDE